MLSPRLVTYTDAPAWVFKPGDSAGSSAGRLLGIEILEVEIFCGAPVACAATAEGPELIQQTPATSIRPAPTAIEMTSRRRNFFSIMKPKRIISLGESAC